MARVIHFEIPVKDAAKTIKFYESALNWSIQKWDGPMEYYMVMTGEEGTSGINGGLYIPDEGITGIVNTVDVTDLDATLAKVSAAGGQIAMPKHAIPGMGWLAYAKDPEGNLFGMMQMDSSVGTGA